MSNVEVNFLQFLAAQIMFNRHESYVPMSNGTNEIITIFLVNRRGAFVHRVPPPEKEDVDFQDVKEVMFPLLYNF